MPLPVAASYKMWVCRRPLAEIAGSNPTGGNDVCREFCVLSGIGFCDGSRPMRSTTTVCVCVGVCMCVCVWWVCVRECVCVCVFGGCV